MTEGEKQDTVYADEKSAAHGFAFDEKVAEVFQDMIMRSVPGYGLMLEIIGLTAGRYARPGTNCYDLGCSLGAATLQIIKNAPVSCHVIAVDNSEAMVRRCREKLSGSPSIGGEVPGRATHEVRLEDIRETAIDNASVAVLNFTLQFLPRDERQQLLARIWEGLVPGGVLLLAEKLVFPDAAESEVMTDLHLAFKKANGYSDGEISRKRAALENVLVPDTLEEHLSRLREVGFSHAGLCARALNFAGLIALK